MISEEEFPVKYTCINENLYLLADDIVGFLRDSASEEEDLHTKNTLNSIADDILLLKEGLN